MDYLALTSVVSSAALGLAGLAAAVSSTRQQATLIREERSQQRQGSAYIDLLTWVEEYAQWIHSVGDRLLDRADDEYDELPTRPVTDKPDAAARARMAAMLGAFGSPAVKDRYRDWLEAVDAIEDEHRLLEWNHYQDFGGAPEPIRGDTLTKMTDELRPIEKTVREALVADVAADLSQDLRKTRRWLPRRGRP